MEFRYRAVDSDRPRPATDTALTQPTNPYFPLFSARPVQGSSGDHVLEATQREIEKEQIRQEIIIIAETARRKELLAEVVQEMAIEREMAIRSVADTTAMSLEEKLTMWINQKNSNLFRQNFTYSDPMMFTGPYSLVTSPMMELLQIQQMPEATGASETSIMESNKEKLIVLNRADPIGAKCKADDTQTCLESAKRKADGVERGLSEPFQRKRLKSKERALEMKRLSVRNMSVETGETASSKLPCLGTVESEPKFKFWCEICKVGAFCETVMKSHKLGKKHKAAVEKQNERPQMSASTSFINGPPVIAPQSEAITVLEMAAKETGNKTEGEKKKKVTLWCETCKIRTRSKQLMEIHKLGKKHKSMLGKQLRKPLAVLDTNIITVPVRSLNDDPGDKASMDHKNVSDRYGKTYFRRKKKPRKDSDSGGDFAVIV